MIAAPGARHGSEAAGNLYRFPLLPRTGESLEDIHGTGEGLESEFDPPPHPADRLRRRMNPLVQWPFHLGGRFSMKASIPSPVSSAIMLQAITSPA